MAIKKNCRRYMDGRTNRSTSFTKRKLYLKEDQTSYFCIINSSSKRKPLNRKKGWSLKLDEHS